MATKETESQTSARKRRRLERQIIEQVKHVLKSGDGERSTDEGGIKTVILETGMEVDGKKRQLMIEDYPKALGNYTFVSKLLGEDKESDGFIIINKKTGTIAGREENTRIETLCEYLNLLSVSNNHHNPQPSPPQV